MKASTSTIQPNGVPDRADIYFLSRCGVFRIRLCVAVRMILHVISKSRKPLEYVLGVRDITITTPGLIELYSRVLCAEIATK